MIAQLRAGKPGDIIWDRGERGSVKGLHARVLSDGSISFYFYHRTKAGQQRRPKLGEFGELTVAEARLRAKTLAKRVDQGEDPRGDWEKAKAEHTMQDLFDYTEKDYWRAGKVTEKWADEMAAQWRNHIQADFGSKPFTAMRPKLLREWLKKFEAMPRTGNICLNLLSTVFNFAQAEELIPLGTNPCVFVDSYKEKSRRRKASADEMQKIGAILARDEEESPGNVAFIYLLMFSGARPSVIENARWDQLTESVIDGELWGSLLIHGKTSSKTGEEDVIILPPQAMRVISKLPRVLGGTIVGVKKPRKYWMRVRQEAGCEDLWLRDWRRTFASVGLSDGEKLDTIGELLNHRSTQTTKIYAKLFDHARLKAAGSIAEKMAELTGPKES